MRSLADCVEDAAWLMTYHELLPAEDRDLTDVLRVAGSVAALMEPPPSEVERKYAALWSYLLQEMSVDRLERWRTLLLDLSGTHPAVRFAVVTDSTYPGNLAPVFDAPPFLFCTGRLTTIDVKSLAVVGSRRAHPASLAFADAVARRCAAEGVLVISGLADGVDTAAHSAALAQGGRTVAVIAGGIDRERRAESRSLAMRICESGCTVTASRPRTPATPSGLVARNRIISGLSAVSLVVEGGPTSGTRSEAESALRQGRFVLLWAHGLQGFDWAEKLALDANVSFVTTVDDVFTTLNSLSHGGTERG